MTRRLVSTFAGFILIVTMIAAAPARAGSQEDAFRAIAGAVVLFAIGKALADELDNKNAPVSRTNTLPDKSRVTVHGNAPLKYKNRPKHSGKKQTTRTRFQPLPSECYFEATTYRRLVGVYGARCLEDRQRHASLLPVACQFQLPIQHGRSAKVYDAACLREFGWAEERRAHR